MGLRYSVDITQNDGSKQFLLLLQEPASRCSSGDNHDQSHPAHEAEYSFDVVFHFVQDSSDPKVGSVKVTLS